MRFDKTEVINDHLFINNFEGSTLINRRNLFLFINLCKLTMKNKPTQKVAIFTSSVGKEYPGFISGMKNASTCAVWPS
jgi:hypothetical protein